MTLDKIIKTTLEPITGLDKHVYPLEALKNAAAPFVFYLQMAEDGENALDGLTGLQSAAFEVNVVAKTYASLIWLAGSVKLALQALQGTTHEDLTIERVSVRQTSPDLKEQEVDLYRRCYALQVNYQKEEMTNE